MTIVSVASIGHIVSNENCRDNLFLKTYSRGVAELTLFDEAFFFAPLEAIFHISCLRIN